MNNEKNEKRTKQWIYAGAYKTFSITFYLFFLQRMERKFILLVLSKAPTNYERSIFAEFYFIYVTVLLWLPLTHLDDGATIVEEQERSPTMKYTSGWNE